MFKLLALTGLFFNGGKAEEVSDADEHATVSCECDCDMKINVEWRAAVCKLSPVLDENDEEVYDVIGSETFYQALVTK